MNRKSKNSCLWMVGLSLGLLLATGCRTVPVHEERLLADTRINNQPVHFAYDTGSEGTVIFIQAAKRLKLSGLEAPPSDNPPPGKVLTGRTGFCQFTVGAETYNLKLSTLQLPWGLNMDVDGLIGWPDIKDDLISVDARADRLKSLEQLPANIRQWTRLPIAHTGVLALEIPRADGRTGILEVDTGNPAGVSLSPARWKAWRAKHQHAHGSWELSLMPGSGVHLARKYQADKLVLGPLVLTNVPVCEANQTEVGTASSNEVFEASIGLIALRQLDFIADQKARLGYLRPHWNFAATNLLARTNSANLIPVVATGKNTIHFRFREQEYGDHAVDDFNNGKYAEAITNANHLLKSTPDNAPAFDLRGEALFILHATDGNLTYLNQSLVDLNHALALDPGIANACYCRANIYYLTQQWYQAAGDFSRYCELAPDDANYSQFFIWIIRARTGHRSAADEALTTQIAAAEKKGIPPWELTIGNFLLGRINEPDFFRAAARPSQAHAGHICEAWFYAGIKQRLAGNLAIAHDYFQKCVATGQKDEDEYNFAAAELRTLSQVGSNDAKRYQPKSYGSTGAE